MNQNLFSMYENGTMLILLCFGESRCSCRSVHSVLFWFESHLEEMRSQDGETSDRFQGELSSNE